MDVVFLAVNYNTVAHSLAFARRFDDAPALKSRAALVLVDNSTGSHAGELASALSGRGSRVACVASGENLGYFGGARFGLGYIRSLPWSFRWLVVSNVDLQFDPESVVAGLSGIDPLRTGVVAPNIMSGLTGTALNPYMRSRPSALRMRSYKWIYRFYPTMRLYEGLSMVRGRMRAAFSSLGNARLKRLDGSDGIQDIYAGHGSMLAFSYEFFNRGGNLDHAPFLFGEEISVAETARRIGLALAWHPGIVVEHAEHVSIGQLPGRRMHGFLKEATAFCADAYFR